MEANKLKMGVPDVIKGAVFLCAIVGLYYKLEGELTLVSNKVDRNTIEISQHNQEFKVIHNEFKEIMKEINDCKDEVLEKIDQKHSK